MAYILAQQSASSQTIHIILGACLFRERQKQKYDNLQNKKGEYAETVEKLNKVTLDNQQLEQERRQLESELNELQYIKPSGPTHSNGYSDSDSNNSSSTPITFSSRVGRHIPVEPAQAVAYRKTEQAWFAKVGCIHAEILTFCMKAAATCSGSCLP